MLIICPKLILKKTKPIKKTVKKKQYRNPGVPTLNEILTQKRGLRRTNNVLI